MIKIVGEKTIASLRINHRLLKKESYVERKAVAAGVAEAEVWAKRATTCHCYGCGRVSTMFCGSRRIGWLRFCSKHREVALALTRYFHAHRTAT